SEPRRRGWIAFVRLAPDTKRPRALMYFSVAKGEPRPRAPTTTPAPAKESGGGMGDLRFSRRRFISSAGVTVTLPMLPSLLYSRRAGAATCAPIKRFLAYHFPNGHHMVEH